MMETRPPTPGPSSRLRAALFEVPATRGSLICVVLLHLLATWVFLPPGEALNPAPLLSVDHPVHTHRVELYREALEQGDWPWGYTPGVSAGLVMTPASDTGAKPQELLGTLFPSLPSGTVVRLFIFVTVLTIPLWTLLACRRFRIPAAAQAWVLVALLGPFWFYGNLHGYVLWGLVSFTAASYFLPYVMALFLDFLERPGFGIWAGFGLAATCLLSFHILGPVVLALPLALLTLFARPLAWRWRLSAAAVPVIVAALNGFWLLPFLAALKTPRRPWPAVSPAEFGRHMTYETWSELAQSLTLTRTAALLVGLGLAVYGFRRLWSLPRRRLAVCLGLAAAPALLLKFFGSFAPVLIDMQPARFLMPAAAVMALPVGVGLWDLATRIRLPAAPAAAALAVLLAVAAPLTGRTVRLPLPPTADPLSEFVARNTAPDERLLIQPGDSETRVLARALKREVIGSPFPFVRDPAQFSARALLGRRLEDWKPDELRAALDRWGIHWVFVRDETARGLIERTLEIPGTPVGTLWAYRVPGPRTRFLVGEGTVRASMNRLALSALRPAGGWIVLRYRYHPAWKADSGVTVMQYPVPEDPAGFIALRNPPPTVNLRFDGLAMLRAPWPGGDSPRRAEPLID